MGWSANLITSCLKSEAGDWSMWLDDQFKLVRILVASDNTEVVRD